MSETEQHKIITVNPHAFKIPDNRTRRKKKETTQIQMKPQSEKKQKPSSLKRNLLKIIRKNQEYRLKLDKQQRQSVNMSAKQDEPIAAQSEFEQSVEFLKKIPKSLPIVPMVNNLHSQTLKNYSPMDTRPVLPFTSVDSDIIPIEPMLPVSDVNPGQNVYIRSPPPYGVLKNGSKPTYKTWKAQTQKNYINAGPKIKAEIGPSPTQINYETRLKDQIKSMSERAQKDNLHNNQIKEKSRNPKKQRRTIRRTYRIGKSKVHPRVSVLISSKTLRNNANLEKTRLRETPISEVKQFLRKQGFIKVGTSTPNDVLRKMYESAKLICGEVYNHNPENLLYNYFNDTNT
jgi:hypothetical protein